MIGLQQDKTVQLATGAQGDGAAPTSMTLN
jgi:hypothetical protein